MVAQEVGMGQGGGGQHDARRTESHPKPPMEPVTEEIPRCWNQGFLKSGTVRIRVSKSVSEPQGSLFLAASLMEEYFCVLALQGSGPGTPDRGVCAGMRGSVLRLAVEKGRGGRVLGPSSLPRQESSLACRSLH